ncbi:hypothetical protein Ddye_026563 [Dipteronia dyeriana]|uniref:Pentatricopeptide repeat-containing protein n=1 Tax=Dipteronia dyeriana TaxID=168575 RepID=A0AAD9TN78_9ROSI|nr:hypothetical protein Ddye_026563 [Dipteronia dyeriana]
MHKEMNDIQMEGRITKATYLFMKMIAFGCRLDVITYATLIKGLCQTGNTSVALKLHEQMVQGNGENESKWEEAKDLIVVMMDQNVHPNVLTFSVIIDVLCKKGNIVKANELLELMIQGGVKPDTITYNTLIDGFFLEGRIDNARELFVSMMKKGITHDVFSYNIMINEYCKNQNLEQAMSLYSKMISEGVMLDTMTYNTLLSGLFRAGKITHAKTMFGEMRLIMLQLMQTMVVSLRRSYFFNKKRKFDLSIETYNCFLQSLCKLDIARKLFHKLAKEGLLPNAITYTIIINGLCKEGRLEEANDLLLNMEGKSFAPNVITYDTLIRGFLHNDETTKVVKLLHKMAERSIMLDASIASIVIYLLLKDEKYRINNNVVEIPNGIMLKEHDL